MPRNERPLSSRMDDAKFAAEKISIGGRIFGSILFDNILILLYPKTFDEKI